jgi:UDP-N-acetylglucosamine 1-carboxyvinyltransferase
LDYYVIKGGKKLKGEVKISGAKNAALPIIVASLLVDGETVLKNVPDLMDIRTVIKVIEYLGAETEFDSANNILKIRINKIKNSECLTN